MRQREEHDVVSGEVLHGGVLEDPVRQAMEMRLQFPSLEPALLWAVMAPMVTSGWPARSLRTSPPA